MACFREMSHEQCMLIAMARATMLAVTAVVSNQCKVIFPLSQCHSRGPSKLTLSI